MDDIYFGCPLTRYKRILTIENQKELKNIFPYLINISQSKNNSIILKLDLIKHSNLHSIIELPPDINKLIREFDTEHFCYELIMLAGRDYPYKGHHWYLKKYNSEINDKKNIISLSIKDENNALEVDWSPIFSPYTGIISILSGIQTNLCKSLNKKPIKKKSCIEKRTYSSNSIL